MKYQVLLFYCLCVCLFSSFKVQAQNNNNARRMAKQLNKQLEVVIDKYVQVSDSLVMYRSVVDAIKLGQECDKYDAMPDITGQVKCQYRERNSLLLKAMRRLIIDAGLYFYKKNNKEEALNAFETYIYSADSPLFSLKHPEIDNFLNEAIFYSAVIAYKLGDYTKTRKFSEMLIDKDEYARDAVELQVLCLKQEMLTKEDSITAEEYARYKYEYGQDDYYDDDNNEDYNNSNNDDNNSNTNSNTNYDYNGKNNNNRDSYYGNNGEAKEDKGTPDRNTSYSNEWRDGRWYNADGTQTYSGTLQWKSNATGWWVEDTDGWYPTDSWQKIDNVWYYFKPDGYMASNEYYNGYWFNADGSWDDKYFLSWKSNSTGWWVEDISGWWPSSSWLKIDGYWYYFDASGYMVTSQYVDGWWISADGVCY